MMADLLIRGARLVPFRSRTRLAALRMSGARPRGGPPGPAPEPVDVLVRDGVVTQVGAGLGAGEPGGAGRAGGLRVLEAGGAFLIPGLWDAHAHLDLEAARQARLDTTATTSAEQALEIVARAARELHGGGPGEGGPVSIQGFGHRLANWPRTPTVAELDAVTGAIPTVLISGDVHSGWLNSAALGALGLAGAGPGAPGGPITEDAWFALLDRLDEIPGSRELRESGYRAVLERMVALGVTGVVDMSWAEGPQDWPRRLAAMSAQGGGPAVLPRIRTAVYRERLQEWIDAGLRTGAPLPGSPRAADGSSLVVQGPLKVIADGSMGTASAHMCAPYPAALGLESPCGVANIGRRELARLMERAHREGYEVAIHAIGDAAMNDVAAAFAASGARGRVEHAQLLPADALARPEGALRRLVACGVELSIQPAHLIDDWAAVGRVWPGLEARSYAFADMMAAGALLHLGSDAPVAPLDPWLAMSAAVGRRTPGGGIWSPEQCLSAEEALAASVGGASSVRRGSRADLVLLERDPLSLEAQELAGLRPVATIVAGAVAWAA